MGKALLPPGFRFHPTDVELIMYYLKRKVMGRKLHFKAIAEVDIYKFSPWDLPDMSCLKSKDREWFFFCPREKKYASGVRVKRATEKGYWKTTGKGRSVCYGDQVVGMVKTLIFHLGHSPRGTRTDWVIHEYKIVDKEVGSPDLLETYTLCKVFEKSGLGPKNNAQYGAPFNEADWSDDDREPVKGYASISETKVPNSQGVTSPSAGHLSNDFPVDENEDEIVRMLSHFAGDPDTCFDSGAINNQGDRVTVEKQHPSSDGFDVYDGLGDFEYLSDPYHDDYALNASFLENLDFIELDDFRWPVSSYADELFGCHHIINKFQQFCPESSTPMPTGTSVAASNLGQPQDALPAEHVSDQPLQPSDALRYSQEQQKQ